VHREAGELAAALERFQRFAGLLAGVRGKLRRRPAARHDASRNVEAAPLTRRPPLVVEDVVRPRDLAVVVLRPPARRLVHVAQPRVHRVDLLRCELAAPWWVELPWPLGVAERGRCVVLVLDDDTAGGGL